MVPIRLVIADDHSLFRAGLIGLLEDMPEFKVIGEAENGQEAVALIQKLQPDIVLMDINMPIMNGVQAVEALSKKTKSAIIMLTISRQEEDLFAAIAAGASGYLLKNAEPEDLRKAILHVAAGKSILSPEVTQPVLKALATAAVPANDRGISKREIEVLECLAQGFTTTQIAGRLFVSENTVKTHIRHILEKLDASNRAEAVIKANQLGMIHVEMKTR
jgi:DNA-binding NarL/FixJ family response regulator